MKRTKTTLYVCQCPYNYVKVASLEMAVQKIFKSYDNSLIAEGSVTAFIACLQKEVDTLLEQHKNWKRMPLEDIPEKYGIWRRVQMGSSWMNFIPANDIITVE